MKYFSDFFNIIFPKRCLGCNSALQKHDGIICSECEKSLEFIGKNICSQCGAKLSVAANHNCEFIFDAARSVFEFNAVLQNLIHHFKYDEIKKLGEFLGNYAVTYLKQEHFADTEIIAPVPLHRVKQRIRGFNQSEFLTRTIAEQMNWKHYPHLIKRKKFTETQTRLSRKQREKNVTNAFAINSKYNIKGRKILLVDDVFTTGSTVNSISKVLQEAGAAKIFVLTIARA